jgi:hypothetical protein
MIANHKELEHRFQRCVLLSLEKGEIQCACAIKRAAAVLNALLSVGDETGKWDRRGGEATVKNQQLRK